jgi:hypothetical protein
MHLHEEGGTEPGEAAQDALALLRDPSNVATVFQVERVLSTLPSDGRPWQTEACGQFNGATGQPI